MSSISLLRLARTKLFWYPDASPDERAEVTDWMVANDCSDIQVIGIDRTVVAAFGAAETLHGWGTTEMRCHHGTLSDTLTEVVTRLRRMNDRMSLQSP